MTKPSQSTEGTAETRDPRDGKLRLKTPFTRRGLAAASRQFLTFLTIL